MTKQKFPNTLIRHSEEIKRMMKGLHYQSRSQGKKVRPALQPLSQHWAVMHRRGGGGRREGARKWQIQRERLFPNVCITTRPICFAVTQNIATSERRMSRYRWFLPSRTALTFPLLDCLHLLKWEIFYISVWVLNAGDTSRNSKNSSRKRHLCNWEQNVLEQDTPCTCIALCSAEEIAFWSLFSIVALERKFLLFLF